MKDSPVSPSASQQPKTQRPGRDLENRLCAYALTAGAAGVSLLVAQPAQGQVAYTPTNITISNGNLFLDLNCGPRINFWLADQLEESVDGGLFREFAANGSAYASVIVDNKSAAQLARGDVIGSSRSFQNVHHGELTLASAYYFIYSGYLNSGVRGNWANGKPGYLGLRFKLNGNAHYGWAEFEVQGTVNQQHEPLVTATLSGYAFELTPNQSIEAGQTKDADSAAKVPGAAAPPAGTLAALARGPSSAGQCPDYEPSSTDSHRGHRR